MSEAPALHDALLQAIAARGGVRRFPAQAVLVNEGDQSDALFIVLTGRVKVYGASADGREVVYNTHGPGEYFGEMSLDGQPRSASVMTLEPTSCVVVPGAQVHDLLASQPEFAMHMVRKLIALLRHSTDNVKSLALDNVYQRVARLLDDLAPAAPGPRLVREKLTQQDIAERVGASREMVSRVFKQLTSGGYVALQGREITLLKKLPADW